MRHHPVAVSSNPPLGEANGPPARHRVEAPADLVVPTWSIYCFALNPDPSHLPPPVRPIPVSRAIDTWTDAVSESEKTFGRGRLDLDDRIFEARAFDALALLASGARALDRGKSPDWIATKIRKLGYALHVQPAPPDVFPDPEVKASYNPYSGATTVWSEMTIPISVPFERVRKLVDPQNWCKLSSLFATTYKVRKGDYQQDQPAPAGQPWQGYLFELFRVPIASFTNILRVDVLEKEGGIRVEYHLHDSLGFTFLGMRRTGVLEVDEGYIEVTPRPDGVAHFKIEKTVVYADLTPGGSGSLIDHGMWLTYTAPGMLGLWLREASKMRVVRTVPNGKE